MTIDRPPPCVRRPELFDPPTEKENREHGQITNSRVPPPNERQAYAIGYCLNACPVQALCLNDALAALAHNPANDIGSILGGTTGPQRREMVQVTRYRRSVSLKKATPGQQLNGYTMDPRRCVHGHPESSIYRIPSGRKRCRDCTKDQYRRYEERHPRRKKEAVA
jgi:hypothetical protein